MRTPVGNPPANCHSQERRGSNTEESETVVLVFVVELACFACSCFVVVVSLVLGCQSSRLDQSRSRRMFPGVFRPFPGGEIFVRWLVGWGWFVRAC